MIKNSRDDLTTELVEILDKLRETRSVMAGLRSRLNGIEPELIGKRVRYAGNLYQIVGLRIAFNRIQVTGVRVNEKTGKIGSRQFYAGNIDITTDVIDGKATNNKHDQPAP